MKSDGSAKREVRNAYKVLEPKGQSRAVCVEPISPRRSVKELKGWRIEPSGKSHQLKPDHIVELGVSTYPGYYDDERTLAASFDEVNSGDVVAFEYSIHYEKGIEGLCQPFTFQTDLPVLHSRLTVALPAGWQLCQSARNIEPITSSVEGDRYTWESGFLAYREEEPFMPPWYYAARSIVFSAFSADETMAAPVGRWDAVSRWAWKMHEEKDGAADSLQMFLSDRCADLTTPEEKLASIASFVRDDIRYVAVEIDHGRLEPRPASTTLLNRYGDCKDKVTLLRSLLDLAGVESSPVLACAEGTVDREFPSPCQFDHVIAAVSLSQLPQFDSSCNACLDGWLYIDPTQPFVELGQLPLHLHGSQVLRMSDSEVDLVTLPEARPEDNRRLRYAEVQLDAGYALKAQVSIVDYGHSCASVRYVRQSKSVDERIDEFLDYFAQTLGSPSITDFASGYAADSAWVTFTLAAEHYPLETGGLKLLKVDIFHNDQPDELKKSDVRQHDIWFGPPSLLETEVVWHLPPQLAADGESDSVDADCPIGRLSSQMIAEDSILTYRAAETYTGGVMAASDFDRARKFLSRINAAGATRVLLNTSGGRIDEPVEP